MAKADNFTLRMAKLMVGGAVFAAAVYAIDLGINRATAWYLTPAIVVGLLAVVVGEILCWHNAGIAWHERRAGSLMLWGILAAVCSVGTLYTNFSTSAISQDEKSSLQLTAFTASDDLRKSEEEATFALKAAQDARSKLKPQRAAADARAAIDSAQAHKWWKYTNGCAEPKGKESRAWCDTYRSAVSDLAMWDDISREDARIGNLKAKVDDVRSERKVTKAVVSDDTPGVALIADVMGGDKALARQIDSMTLPLLIQAIMLFGGILLANEHMRGVPKKPWINWRKVGYYINWVACALSFKPLPAYSESVQNNITVHDDRAMEKLRHLASGLKTANLEAAA